MRDLFPNSILVGWKFELVGTRSDALAKAARQIDENRTDACVLNGRAFGSRFAFCRHGDPLWEFGDKAELVRFLAAWLVETLFGRASLQIRSCARSRKLNKLSHFPGSTESRKLVDAC